MTTNKSLKWAQYKASIEATMCSHCTFYIPSDNCPGIWEFFMEARKTNREKDYYWLYGDALNIISELKRIKVWLNRCERPPPKSHRTISTDNVTELSQGIQNARGTRAKCASLWSFGRLWMGLGIVGTWWIIREDLQQIIPPVLSLPDFQDVFIA